MSAAKGIDWSQQPLGEVNDHELARRLGVSPRSVVYMRQKCGIPAAPRPPPREKQPWKAGGSGFSAAEAAARDYDWLTAARRRAGGAR